MEQLNLQGFSTFGQKELNDYIEITIKSRFKPQSCLYCGYTQLYSHDKTEQFFFDIPMQDKPVILKTQRVRYKCRSCRKTFREPLADIDGKRLMTMRLKEYIQKRSLSSTFTVIAKETGLDEKTIRHVFDDYVEDKAKSMPFETPRVLCISELKLVGSDRYILTNIEKCSIIDILPSRKNTDVAQHLQSLKNPENVQVITMDMWQPYKEAINQVLPHVILVVDKLHILRVSSECLEKARKIIRNQLDRKDRLKLKNDRFLLSKRRHSLTDEEVQKLQQWSTWFPDLGLAYETKEKFYCLFEQDLDSKIAEKAIIDWKKNLPPQIAHYFDDLTVALSNWMREILNSFDYSVPNVCLESINQFVKKTQRMSRGYSFDVVRAKMLYNTEANKPTTYRICKKKPKFVNETPAFYFIHESLVDSHSSKKKYKIEHFEKKNYYGAHIPTLCGLLERDKLD